VPTEAAASSGIETDDSGNGAAVHPIALDPKFESDDSVAHGLTGAIDFVLDHDLELPDELRFDGGQ
jgi:hypothetical protein